MRAISIDDFYGLMTRARRLSADVQEIGARARLFDRSRDSSGSLFHAVARERIGRHVDDSHDVGLRAPPQAVCRAGVASLSNRRRRVPLAQSRDDEGRTGHDDHVADLGLAARYGERLDWIADRAPPGAERFGDRGEPRRRNRAPSRHA